MNQQPLKTLYRKLQKKNYWPSHVAEVGVYIPETSNVYDYIVADVRTTLVEPDPESIRRIEEAFAERNNVTLHRTAAFEYEGTLELSQRDASTFVSQLDASPAIVNDNYTPTEEDQFTVACTTFDTLDDGTIDLLSVDTEGSEWYVLKYLKSRPDVISIETHGAAYLNPHIENIESWMSDNDYALYFKDKTDSVYVRPGKISISFLDRLRLQFYSAKLRLRRSRKRLFNAT